MFISDGTSMVSLDHVVAVRLQDGMLQLGLTTGGVTRFKVADDPSQLSVDVIIAECADNAEVAGLIASSLSSPAFSE